MSLLVWLMSLGYVQLDDHSGLDIAPEGCQLVTTLEY